MQQSGFPAPLIPELAPKIRTTFPMLWLAHSVRNLLKLLQAFQLGIDSTSLDKKVRNSQNGKNGRAGFK